MTPANIAAFAKLNGLDMMAVADHNAIQNVEVAQKAGDAYGITVVPAIEVQTAEEIHVLCLFADMDGLKKFYAGLKMPAIKNRPEIFGEQLVMDEDDNVTGRLENLLLVNTEVSSDELPEMAEKFGGAAVAAHIDRDANGMLQILGAIGKNYRAVELSDKATEDEAESYRKKYRVIVDSDAHSLASIGRGNEIELAENTAAALIKYLRGE
jgi:PHP family Zn ribbon phosphoesterase